VTTRCHDGIQLPVATVRGAGTAHAAPERGDRGRRGAIVALARRDSNLFIPVSVLALWPSLGGHIVEIAFLNVVRSRIPGNAGLAGAVRLACGTSGAARSTSHVRNGTRTVTRGPAD